MRIRLAQYYMTYIYLVLVIVSIMIVIIVLYDYYSDQAMILGKNWNLNNSEEIVGERNVKITKGHSVNDYILF